MNEQEAGLESANPLPGKSDAAGAAGDERRWARICLYHGLFLSD